MMVKMRAHTHTYDRNTWHFQLRLVIIKLLSCSNCAGAVSFSVMVICFTCSMRLCQNLWSTALSYTMTVINNDTTQIHWIVPVWKICYLIVSFFCLLFFKNVFRTLHDSPFLLSTLHCSFCFIALNSRTTISWTKHTHKSKIIKKI